MRPLKRAKAAKTHRLYFLRNATAPHPVAGEPAIEYKAGAWYDGVSDEHAQAVGDAALPMTLDLECGCLLLPDGRAVVTKTRHVPALDGDGKRYERPMTHVEILPHAEACAFEVGE